MFYFVCCQYSSNCRIIVYINNRFTTNDSFDGAKPISANTIWSTRQRGVRSGNACDVCWTRQKGNSLCMKWVLIFCVCWFWVPAHAVIDCMIDGIFTDNYNNIINPDCARFQRCGRRSRKAEACVSLTTSLVSRSAVVKRFVLKYIVIHNIDLPSDSSCGVRRTAATTCNDRCLSTATSAKHCRQSGRRYKSLSEREMCVHSPNSHARESAENVRCSTMIFAVHVHTGIPLTPLTIPTFDEPIYYKKVAFTIHKYTLLSIAVYFGVGCTHGGKDNDGVSLEIGPGTHDCLEGKRSQH